MVKFILPLAFFLTGFFASGAYSQGLGVCDHVDLELIKGLSFNVEIAADGYEPSDLSYDPIKYQGCNVEPKDQGATSLATVDVADKFYFYKGRFTVAADVADAIQAAFNRGESVRLRFENDSVIEMDGQGAK